MTPALITPGMARRERDRLDVEFILASIRSRVGHESADIFAVLVGALITHANQQTATAELLLIAADEVMQARTIALGSKRERSGG